MRRRAATSGIGCARCTGTPAATSPSGPPRCWPSTRASALAERRALGRAGDLAAIVVQLTKVPGSRASYEALLTNTPEGDYRFLLTRPTGLVPQPRAECKVLPPPSELEQIRMNQPEMEQAA